MKRRRRLTLCILLAFIFIGVAILLSLPEAEPSYEGRRLSVWLDDANPIIGEEAKKLAHVALIAIGTNAIPHLLKMVLAHDSFPKQKLAEFSVWQSVVPWTYHYSPAALFQRRAVTGFRELGWEAASAIPAVTRLLKSPDIQIRRRAVMILGSIAQNDDPTARLLLAMAKNTNEPASVRAGAIEVLAAWTNRVDQLLPFFLESMRDSNDRIRALALNAAANIPETSDEVDDALMGLLTSPIVAPGSWRSSVFDQIARRHMSSERQDAARCRFILKELHCFGLPEDEKISVLITLLKSSNQFIAWKATIALGLLHSSPARVIPALIENLRVSREAERDVPVAALIRYGEAAQPAVPALIEMLGETNGRQAAIRGLGVLGKKEADQVIPKLMPFLDDEENAATRRLAITALGQLGKSSANELIPLLIKKYEWPDASQRAAILSALGDLGVSSKEAIDLLLKATKDSDPWVSQNAFLVLLKIDRLALQTELAERADEYDEKVLGQWRQFLLNSGPSTNNPAVFKK